MILVKFIRSHTPYMAGELAGFPDAQAKALISGGVAVAYGSQPEAKVEHRPMGGLAGEQISPGIQGDGSETPPATEFDPLTADVAALKAYLTENGVSFHHKAGEAKLRELAVDVATRG